MVCLDYAFLFLQPCNFLLGKKRFLLFLFFSLSHTVSRVRCGLVISIEKKIIEMNFDIDHVIRLFLSLKYDLLYRLGLDGISAFFFPPL